MTSVFGKMQAENPDENIVTQKLVYVMMCGVGVAMAMYKLSLLGLLPTTDSDWLEFKEASAVSDRVLAPLEQVISETPFANSSRSPSHPKQSRLNTQREICSCKRTSRVVQGCDERDSLMCEGEFRIQGFFGFYANPRYFNQTFTRKR